MEKSPDAFRTISEVAEILETPAHVLRFWESRFPQIRPVKRAGGRRYYRPADVALLTGIKRLLHEEGMTIRGVQKILREQGVRHVAGLVEETTSEEDDAALEAALAAAAGEAGAPPPALPPEQAETAQIIALETAMAARPRPMPQESAPILVEIPDEEPLAPAPGSAQVDLFGWQPASPPPGPPPPAEEAPEAPMAVWVEETQPLVSPLLRLPGSMAPEAVAPAPNPSIPAQDQAEAAAPLAARLRRTSAAGLSSSDRATISLLRARARALHDRLTAPVRPKGGL